MDQLEVQCCIKEVDLTLQPRIAPRYRTWLPLATQQLRLRSLIQIIGHKLKSNEKQENYWFYYTLHRTTMSFPLYTSEPIDNSSPRWTNLELPTLYSTGHTNASEIILRLWKRNSKENSAFDTNVFTWGISFTGLAYIGPKLPNNLESILHDNSLVFYLHGGYFAPPFCLITNVDTRRFLFMNISVSEVRDSYTVSKLSSLRSKMQALKQQTDSVQNLRERIASGENLSVPKYPQTMLNRLLQPKRVNREKKAQILRIRKDLEVAKFRTKLLEQERVRKMGEIRSLNQCHTELMEENQDHGSDLMGRYRALNKDIERLNEWRQNHIDSRETYIQTTARLAHRRKQLISEISFIYPISQEQEDDQFLINYVHLPESEKLDNANDTQVAVALGFAAHTTQMIANFLNVPTRYPIIHYGSRSKIVDYINENLPESDRQFPLFARGKDKLQFHYAVYLLNKNIAQLRWYCGLPTNDLRPTLQNLAGLINIKLNYNLDSSKRTFSGSSLDVDLGNVKSNILSVHKILSDKCHRTTRSISHFKGTKTLLGSSLDQGLNQPVIQSPNLNNQSKRICKSEESSMDNATSPLPTNLCNMSSDETLNESIFDKAKHSINNTHENSNTEKISNLTIEESEIEIMVPMSVSKPKINSDSVENFTNTRQRSSNSVSSCEMALSSSLVEGEDSSNGNSSFKSCDRDGVFVSQENLKSVSNNRHSFDLDNDDSLAASTRIVENTCAEETLVIKANDASNSSNTTVDCDKRQMNKNDSSEKSSDENHSSTCDTVSRQQQTHLQMDANTSKSTVRELKMEQSCDSSLEDGLASNICEVQNKIRTNNFASSTEYIDSIQSVFARTEALANKTTSFKVMRPRL